MKFDVLFLVNDASGSPAPATGPAVVTKAAVRAADRLELSNRVLAAVLGVSEATVSRMGAGTYQLDAGQQALRTRGPVPAAVPILDAIVGGDAAVARAWLRNDNTALGATPIR